MRATTAASFSAAANSKAAEDWLARTPPDADPAPTTLQSEYVLASRQATTRRQRVLLVTSLAVTIVALGLGLLALLSRNQAVSARNKAVSAGNIARSQALAAESQNELTADPEVSVLLARQAVRVTPTPQAVSALRQAMDASAVRVALPIESVGSCKYQAGSFVAYDPAGDRVAEGSCTGQVTVADATTGRVVFERHLPTQEDTVAYDPDGRHLAVATRSGIALLDPSTGVTTSRLAGHGEPTSLAFNPDGSMVAETTNLGVTVWDLATGASRSLIVDPLSDYSSLAFTADGSLLVVGTDLGYTAVVDVASGNVVRRLTPPGQTVTSGPGSVSPVALAGNLLVVGENVNGTGDTSGDIDVWNTTTWTMSQVLTPVTGTAIASVAVSPDQQTVAVGNADGTGGIWSLYAHEELVPISGQTASLNTVAFSPDSADVVTAANDGTSRIYRATGPWVATMSADLCGCGNEIGWRHNTMVGTDRVGNDIVLQAWHIPSGRQLPGARVLSTDQQNEGVVLSRDGSRAALFNDEAPVSTVTVVDTATGHVVFVLPSTTVAGVAISDDDHLLAVTGATGELHVVTLSTGHTVVGHGWPDCDAGNGDNLVISANDRWVAHSSFCGQVSIGRTATATLSASFDQHQQVSSIAFNPAGTRLAVASWDSIVSILGVPDVRPVLELLGHSRGVNDVTYSPGGQYIVTTSTDRTARVWNASTGQLLQVDHDQSSTGNPSVDPDSRFVVEFNANDQIRLWDLCPDCLAPSALLAASNSAVVSPLTPIERHEAASSSG